MATFDFTTPALPSGAALTRASVGTRFNSAGTLVTETTNVARFTYDPFTLALQGLLVEPSRTNGLLRSEDFSNGMWGKNFVSGSTFNSATAPDGNATADSMVDDNGTSGGHVWYQTPGAGAAGTYSHAYFVKAAGRNYAMARFTGSISDYAVCIFDLVNVTTAITVTAGSRFSNVSASIVKLLNGWFRIGMTATASSSWIGHVVQPSNVANPTYGDYGDVVYTGNGTASLRAWGAGSEVGSTLSSYISTAGSAVTRSADVLTLTLANGTYDIDITRLSGVTNLTGQVVSAGTFIVPTDVSPLQSVVVRFPPLAASGGTFAIAGTAAALTALRQASAASGSFSVAGTDAGLLALHTSLAAVGGTFSVAGTDADLLASRNLAADDGTFSSVGTDADYLTTRNLAADDGTFSSVGTDADLLASHTPLDAASDTFAVTETDAGLLASHTPLDAASDAFEITGTAAIINKGFSLSAGSSAVAVDGQDLAFPIARILIADDGLVFWTGETVNLFKNIVTPFDRIGIVAAENRTATVAAENRIATAA